MKNSEARKCGRLSSNLKEQCTLGNDQCPKTPRKANDVLTNHKWDNAWNVHQKEVKKQCKENCQKKNNNNGCGNQNKESEEKPQLMQKEKMHYCCRKTGHMAPDCPERETKPRNEWHMHKAVNVHQKEDDCSQSPPCTTSDPCRTQPC